MKRPELCNYDCFHCPYEDCRNSNPKITKWESKVMAGVHWKWERDALISLISRMVDSGIDQVTARRRLGISRHEFHTLMHDVYDRREAHV